MAAIVDPAAADLPGKQPFVMRRIEKAPRLGVPKPMHSVVAGVHVGALPAELQQQMHACCTNTAAPSMVRCAALPDFSGLTDLE